jgi:hypothetical protein
MQTSKTQQTVLKTLAFLLILIGGIWLALIFWMNYIPSNLDLATNKLTVNGHYLVSYQPKQPIEVNRMHQWQLQISSPDGEPINDAEVLVDGDMPQHGHGLPTQPQVSPSEQGYLVEGLKFHMSGWWVVDFDITHKGIRDTVRFNFILE